ncbi:MAG: hypothetical protein ACK5Q5_12575, partial [Planctomycetaceae bacterium]
ARRGLTATGWWLFGAVTINLFDTARKVLSCWGRAAMRQPADGVTGDKPSESSHSLPRAV